MEGFEALQEVVELVYWVCGCVICVGAAILGPLTLAVRWRHG